jgi:predicted ribosome quality control (RQC) complex YloA/Tae2 family protein
MEGLYLSALIPLLRNRIQGVTCSMAGLASTDTLALRFGDGWLLMHHKPDAPGLWWSADASVVPPASPAWEHHLRGALVESVTQQGADRVLEISFREKTPYDRGGVRLIFELTGRNANIILARNSDSRILACMRKVLSSVNRYRTVSPGSVYIPPPPSGFPPCSWSDPEVREALGTAPDRGSLRRLLEGVGPCIERAVLSHSPDVHETLTELKTALVNESFRPWMSPLGPVPIPLGPGQPIEDPLSQPRSHRGAEPSPPSRSELMLLMGREEAALMKKIASARRSLNGLCSPDELRDRGNLLLTYRKLLRKGMREAVLTHWDGTESRIPLKESLNPVENAERCFRRAGKVHLERERLEGRIASYLERIDVLRARLEGLSGLDANQAAALLQEYRKKTADSGKSEPNEYELSGGWRCIAGRNAGQNDMVTFRLASRDDIWLHVRGVAGAHVIIRRDGRSDNPSACVLEEAARIAASHSSSNGIVPVDWTLVKYVRRVRGGGPGQVIYTREKTIFTEAIGKFDK